MFLSLPFSLPLLKAVKKEMTSGEDKKILQNLCPTHRTSLLPSALSVGEMPRPLPPRVWGRVICQDEGQDVGLGAFIEDTGTLYRRKSG